jgi:hypothetical protein
MPRKTRKQKKNASFRNYIVGINSINTLEGLGEGLGEILTNALIVAAAGGTRRRKRARNYHRRRKHR